MSSMAFSLVLAERDHEREQVGARAEGVRRVVADDEAHALALGAVDGLHRHGDDVLVDGVHLGVELEAEDAVAEVEDRRAAVALDLAARGADRVEREVARVAATRP